MDLLGNKKCAQIACIYLDCHFVLRLYRPLSCAKVAQTYKIAILCSGHMDLYDYHFVFRLHGPIWLPFCAQVTQTYTIDIVICILHSGHMDHFCMCELTAQRDFGFWQLFCHFALRPDGPIQSPFCTQDTQTYIIAILCSGCMDLLYLLQLSLQSTLKYYNAAIPTCCSSPQCTHVLSTLFYKLWHYKY